MASEADSTIYEFDNFRIDAGKRLLLNGGGDPISLTPKIFDTLLYLVSHNGKVIDKDELMSAIWTDTIVEENNLNKNISVLRHVLGETPGEHRFIATVPGKGYKFVASVVESSANGLVGASDGILLPSSQSNADDSEILPERRTVRSALRKSAFATAGVIAAVAVAALALGYWYFYNQRQIDSIAVMPFVNESGNAELEYLSDGMTETLIGSLSKLPGLQVKARSSVFRYKGRNIDAQTIGKELNAQAVLYGRVVQRGEDLVLHVELVDAQTENSLWGQTYNKKLSNLIALEGEVARELVSKLSIKLSGADEQNFARKDTENVEARQLFLKGQFYTRKLTPPEINKGIGYLQGAIEKDPSYALAYAEIASAHRALAMAGEMHPSELLKSKAAAQKAIEIDDSLAEAHSSLAHSIFFYDWNWPEAENHYLRALELDPNSSMSHILYADFLGKMGRRDEAAAKMNRAQEIEPFSAFVNAFASASQPDADVALERARFAIELDPNFYFAHMMAGQAYRRKKMYADAIEESRLAKRLSPVQTYSDVFLAYSLIDIGRPDEARAILDEMLRNSRTHFVPPFHIALIQNALGETDQALATLEKGCEVRDPRMTFLKVFSNSGLKNLRENPRFQDIMRRVGF